VSLDVNRVNRNCVLFDLMMDGKKSHRVDLSIDPECYVLVGHRTNVMDDRNDLKMVVNLLNRNCALRDQNLGVMTGVNHDRHMNDLLDDLSLVDDHHDVPVGHRMNVMDDPNDLMMVVNHVNRNCVLPDLMKDGNLDGMNPHVRLMDDQSKSCDRMSHDHWRYDHLKMRHRDTNRMDVKNLDVKMMNRPVIHRMKVCPKTDDPKMI
jgi:hypothetical protein